jgi:hypothetical protein
MSEVDPFCGENDAYITLKESFSDRVGLILRGNKVGNSNLGIKSRIYYYEINCLDVGSLELWNQIDTSFSDVLLSQSELFEIRNIEDKGINSQPIRDIPKSIIAIATRENEPYNKNEFLLSLIFRYDGIACPWRINLSSLDLTKVEGFFQIPKISKMPGDLQPYDGLSNKQKQTALDHALMSEFIGIFYELQPPRGRLAFSEEN